MENMPILAPDVLRRFLDGMVKDPSLKAKADGTTFCNQAVQQVCHLECYKEFDGLLANEIIEKMNGSSEWLNVRSIQASDWAQRGGIGVAALPGTPHGHVAVLYPGPMQTSGSLGRDVPIVANVGKKNAVMKVSAAFPVKNGEPGYWIHVG